MVRVLATPLCYYSLIIEPGIGLFTYHKYRKSIDSQVPLDAHGNPIEDAGFEGDQDIHQLHSLVDEERQLLTANAEQESTGPTVSLPLDASWNSFILITLFLSRRKGRSCRHR